jgi:hypothetical protein
MTDSPAEKAVKAGKKQRSAAYPSITLEQAIEYSKILLDAYRRNSYSREDAVKAMGYKKITGDNAQRIAALGHYGLVERDGSAYKNSALAETILHFENEEDRAASIRAAAQKPKLFRALISTLNGQALPSRLASILIRSHEINPNVADKVADNFKKTLEYSGIAQNGIVSVTASIDANDDEDEAIEANASIFLTQQNRPSGNSSHNPSHSAPAHMQSVTLPCGVVVSFPPEMAFQFIAGKFANEISALNDVVAEATKKNEEPA